MRIHSRFAMLTLFVAIASALLTPPVATATVTVDDVVLVERTRVGRTTFNYTYAITVTNSSPIELEDVTAYLSTNTNINTHDDPTTIAAVTFAAAGVHSSANMTGTIFFDDVIELGDLPAGATVTSTDTIMLQQDRSFQLSPGALFFEIGYAATVTLTGVVTDQPISFAVVEVTIDHGESGRPIIESGRPIIERFTTTADGEGNYSVDVAFVADPDFVDISADGVDALDFVKLTSIAGSAGAMLEDATAGPTRAVAAIQVDGAEVNALNVTHVSTALTTLAIQANDGEGFTNDEDLAAAQSQVANDELLLGAAVLKTVIDNPGITLPDGIADTQELLDNPSVFNEFVEDLQEEFPEEFQAAIDETIDDLSVGYVTAEVPELLYLSLVRENPLRTGANVFTFDQAGNATHIDINGQTSDADWVVNADGHIVVDLNNPPVTEFFPTVEVPPGSGNFQQVRALTNLLQLSIVRIAVGIASDQVLLGTTTITTFPDHVGVLPDQIDVSEPSPDSGYLSFDATGIVPYTAEELDGQSIEMTYFHSANDSLEFDPARGADLLTFGANGSGSTARRQFAFAWAIDADGRLTVTFDNGDSTEYVRYARSGQDLLDIGVLIGRYGEVSVVAFDSIGVRLVPGTQFDEATLLNRKLRSGFQIVDPDGLFSSVLPRFDFNFLPAGEGCRDAGFVNEFDWSINPQGYMELQRSFLNPPGPPVVFRQRSWQAVAAVSGVLGTRYWVIENLDTGSSLTDPNFPTDPTQVPGRVNFYEDIASIAGNTAPTAVADSASTAPDTPVVIDLIANDTDPDDDPIMFVSIGGTTLGGTVDLVFDAAGIPTGAVTYTPPAGVSGVTDNFTYSIVDGSCGFGAIGAGVVSVTIGAVRTR